MKNNKKNFTASLNNMTAVLKVKNTLTFGLSALALLFTVASCEKPVNHVAFDKSTTAGTLASLSCADTASVPVDANGIITATTLTKNKLWKLNGVSYVKDGQTLTIEAGTTIITGSTKSYEDPKFGKQNIAGVLVVAKGGKLIANGTAAEPIVFTSPSAGGCGSGCSKAGAFGGIVMLGKATTNRTTPTRIEGIPQPAGVDITYGGAGNTINNDNSGSLKYVRIEFAGYKLAEDNEINGLTLGGVGAGTTLSHIQVSYSADDAFEFFGGTVNADHLVAIGTDDDDYDFDHGYTGTINYAVGLKNPGTTNSGTLTNSDSNGIESDNDGTGTNALPRTRPVLRHFTILGYNSTSPKLRNGNRWRRATDLDIQSSIIAGFPGGILFESAATIASANGLTNNLVHAFNAPAFINATPAGNISGIAPNANDFLQLGAGEATSFLTCGNSASFDAEDLIPNEGSHAFGTAATYKGAFQPGVKPWTSGWTKFNLQFCCN